LRSVIKQNPILALAASPLGHIRLHSSFAKPYLPDIRADVLRLIHTAIERVDGKPQQRVDSTSSDGSMSPRAHSDAVLDALRAKHAPESDGEAP